jgi:hypothetical protein
MRARHIANLAVVSAVFGITAAIMLAVLPRPLRAVDYMLSGTVATIAAMVVVFMIVILPVASKREIFYRKRARQKKQELS